MGIKEMGSVMVPDTLFERFLRFIKTIPCRFGMHSMVAFLHPDDNCWPEIGHCVRCGVEEKMSWAIRQNRGQ